MNTETRKAALIAELETIQRRWGEIQQALAELRQAEHDAAHTDLYASSFNLQQRRLVEAAELEAQRNRAQAEKEAAWRASQPDVMAAKRRAIWETEQMTGRPVPVATPSKK